MEQCDNVSRSDQSSLLWMNRWYENVDRSPCDPKGAQVGAPGQFVPDPLACPDHRTSDSAAKENYGSYKIIQSSRRRKGLPLESTVEDSLELCMPSRVLGSSEPDEFKIVAGEVQ